MENETEECKHQPVCFCDEDNQEDVIWYNVMFTFPMYILNITVEAPNRDEAIEMATSIGLDEGLSFDHCQEIDTDC